MKFQGYLIDALVATGAVNQQSVLSFTEVAKEEDLNVVEYLFLNDLVTEEHVQIARAYYHRTSYVDQTWMSINSEDGALAMFTEQCVRERGFVPLAVNGKELTVAVADPEDPNVDEIAFLINDWGLKVVVALKSAIDDAIGFFKAKFKQEKQKVVAI